MTTLVDSNVILDVVTDDQEWGDWSASMLAQAAHEGRIVINPLINAEVSVRYARIEDLDDALPLEYFAREALPWAAAFLAAKAFVRYRRRGGSRPAPLPDFYIGAERNPLTRADHFTSAMLSTPIGFVQHGARRKKYAPRGNPDTHHLRSVRHRPPGYRQTRSAAHEQRIVTAI